jgi:hypothetical protein
MELQNFKEGDKVWWIVNWVIIQSVYMN